MTISQFNSRSERERERESNLSFASSLFKKSFTLIELSIVLLILSLLVGSLLVGRQIVDRAKIQRIIFEFDYYEKAFHQFYDTYRTVPGNLDDKTCLKYANFKGCTYYGADYNGVRMDSGICPINATHEQWCEWFSTKNVSNKKIVHGGWSGYWGSMNQLRASGMIDASAYPYLAHNATNGRENRYTFPVKLNGYYSGCAGHAAQASFDQSLILFFRGNSLAGTNSGAFKYYQEKLPNKNVLCLYNPMVRHNTNRTNGLVYDIYQTGKYGALSSKMASELDAKIDDGRPGTGSIMAYKAEAHNDADEKACFDKNRYNVGSAIYHSDTDLKYGCNMIKVLADVR